MRYLRKDLKGAEEALERALRLNPEGATVADIAVNCAVDQDHEERCI